MELVLCQENKTEKGCKIKPVSRSAGYLARQQQIKSTEICAPGLCCWGPSQRAPRWWWGLSTKLKHDLLMTSFKNSTVLPLLKRWRSRVRDASAVRVGTPWKPRELKLFFLLLSNLPSLISPFSFYFFFSPLFSSVFLLPCLSHLPLSFYFSFFFKEKPI